MNKSIILSALLISQPLVLATAEAGPLNRISAVEGSSQFSLTSKSKIMYRGVNYSVIANLEVDKYSDHEKIFEMQGSIFLVAKNDRTLQVGANDDSDGKMMFEKISEDEKVIQYKGYSCSSTFKDCESEKEGDIILEKDKKTGAFSLSLDIRREIEGSDQSGRFQASTPLFVKKIQLF